MFSKIGKAQILPAIATLGLLLLAAGCTGFFRNPTLTSITISPPTPNVQQGTTLQMTATGTFDDGSTSTLSKNLFWSSSDTTIATINTSGVLSGVAAGQTTITASSANITATTTANVTLANVTGITISPGNTSTTQNTNVNYTCMATVQGSSTQVDVTSSVQWTTNNTNVTIANGQNPAVAMVGTLSSVPTAVTITATYTSNAKTLTANATLNVN
jgi:hypothetical protein